MAGQGSGREEAPRVLRRHLAPGWAAASRSDAGKGRRPAVAQPPPVPEPRVLAVASGRRGQGRRGPCRAGPRDEPVRVAAAHGGRRHGVLGLRGLRGLRRAPPRRPGGGGRRGGAKGLAAGSREAAHAGCNLGRAGWRRRGTTRAAHVGGSRGAPTGGEARVGCRAPGQRARKARAFPRCGRLHREGRLRRLSHLGVPRQQPGGAW